MNSTLLSINLSSGSFETEAIPEGLHNLYLGGSGIAAYYALNEQTNLAPLDPNQQIYVMAGLLTGIYAPAACKASFCGRSPLTGIWNESTVGGHFGAKLKASGYHGLRISGRAGSLSALYIDENSHTLHDAGHLSGLDAYECDRALKRQFGDKVVTACIGPAGERMIPFASVMIGGHEGRAAGRGGMGALLASKNLKAIVVGGSLKPAAHNPQELKSLVKEANIMIRKSAAALGKFGTAGNLPGFELSGDMPFRNFGGSGRWEEGAQKTCGQAILGKYFVKHYGCFGCPIQCGKIILHPETGSEGVHSPEYETAAGFGGLCLNDDPETVIKANDICNRMGLDTISTAGSIAFAIELYEKGLLKREDCDGLELRWGDGGVILDLVLKIAAGEGIGKLLGKGVRKAAEELGSAASAYSIHTKGMEYPYHDPRAFPSMGINYATANRGACHLEALTYFVEGGALKAAAVGFAGDCNRHDPADRADLAVRMQNYMNVLNALGICKFIMRGGITPAHIAQWLKAAYDMDLRSDELMRAGARLHTLKRLYNCNLGVCRDDDTIPLRFLTADRGGASAGVHPDMERMLREYYEIRGWSDEGIPLREKVLELGIKI